MKHHSPEVPAKQVRSAASMEQTKHSSDKTSGFGEVYTMIALLATSNLLNQADRIIMPIAVLTMADTFGWTMMEKGWV